MNRGGSELRVLHVGWGFSPWRGGGLIEYLDDLMVAQAGLGLAVGYFCSGRQVLLPGKARLKRWRRNGIVIHEIVNSPIYHLGEKGTVPFKFELMEPLSELLFRGVLEDFRPDVIHFHELAGLPSSLVRIAGAYGIPTVYTIHDYYLLCPTLKLFRHDGVICTEIDPSRECVQCCCQPVDGRWALRKRTLGYYLLQLPLCLPFIRMVMNAFSSVTNTGCANGIKAEVCPLTGVEMREGLISYYRERRITNLEVISLIDVLISQSYGAKRFFEMFSPRPDIRVLHSSLRHIESIRYSPLGGSLEPLRFITLNGLASREKGGGLILEAVGILQRSGLAGRFRVDAYGSIDPVYRAMLAGSEEIQYKGEYEGANLDRMLEGYHVGLVPSVWEEIYGYVGTECIAKGIPVIGNKRGGISDYVVPGVSGWINEEGSANGLARIMERLILNTGEVHNLNRSLQQGRNDILSNLDRHVQDIIAVYKQLGGCDHD